MEVILSGWKNELFQSITPFEEYERKNDEAFVGETQRIMRASSKMINVSLTISAGYSGYYW